MAETRVRFRPASPVDPSPERHQPPETHERLEIDSESDDSSVDETFEVSSLASTIEDQLTLRGRMQNALHSSWFHFLIVALVVVDAFIVLFELLLDVGAFGNVKCIGDNFLEEAEFCHFDKRYRNECEPHAQLILDEMSLSERGDGKTGICRCDFRHGEKVCLHPDIAGGVNPALVLHYCSLAILSIFVIEIALKLVAFRLKFFTHKFEVFDATVVLLSWVLDVASLQEEEAFEAASLLIVLRLWRVVRIVNGTVLSAKTQSDKELEHARKEARKVIHAYHKCQEKLRMIEKDNGTLKSTLEQNSIPIPSNVTSPLVQQSSVPAASGNPPDYGALTESKGLHMQKFLASSEAVEVKPLPEKSGKPSPEQKPHSIPADEPHSVPADRPHSTPADEPHSTPADEPHSTPADEPPKASPPTDHSDVAVNIAEL